MHPFFMILISCIAFSSTAQRLALADDPSLESQAEAVSSLSNELANGVDQCFNPSHANENAQAKQKFLALAAKAQAIQDDIRSGAKDKLAQDAASIQTVISSFNTKTPFPEDLACATERACLELGFQGNTKYPNCLPVNDDVTANPQYKAFELLVDTSLPELEAGLGLAAASHP